MLLHVLFSVELAYSVGRDSRRNLVLYERRSLCFSSVHFYYNRNRNRNSVSDVAQALV